MLQRPFLGMRHTCSVSAKMIYALVKEMRWKLCLEYQTDIHYHVFLTINVARKVEDIIGQQTTAIEFSPWRWRNTPPQKFGRDGNLQ